MIMEFKLDPQKVEDAGYDIKRCYKVLDDGFDERGFIKKDEGMYWIDDFGKMQLALISLTNTKWFTDVVGEWYWRIINDSINARSDCLASFLK